MHCKSIKTSEENSKQHQIWKILEIQSVCTKKKTSGKLSANFWRISFYKLQFPEFLYRPGTEISRQRSINFSDEVKSKYNIGTFWNCLNDFHNLLIVLRLICMKLSWVLFYFTMESKERQREIERQNGIIKRTISNWRVQTMIEHDT